MGLRDTIAALHVDNMVLKQRLAVSRVEEQKIVAHDRTENILLYEQLKALGSIIAKQYNRTFARGRFVSDSLPVNDMIFCLKEIFASMDSARHKHARVEEKRAPSPAFTFAAREDLKSDAISFKIDTMEVALTTSSETEGKQERVKGRAGFFLEEQCKKEIVSARAKVKKKGFLGLFGRNIDTSRKCK